MRLLPPISDSEEDDPLTYGLMPLELKAEASELGAGLLGEGECCPPPHFRLQLLMMMVMMMMIPL